MAPVTQRSDDTRARVLTAALASFDAHGIQGASVADIRARSGVSVGSIYHHFTDKEGVAAELFLRGLAGYQHGLLGLLEGAGAQEGIRGAIAHHLAWHRADPALARFVHATHPASLPDDAAARLAERNRRFFSTTRAWWRGHVEAGALQELDPRIAYALWLGPAQEICRQWLLDPDPDPRELDRARAPLADAAWRGLRAHGGTT